MEICKNTEAEDKFVWKREEQTQGHLFLEETEEESNKSKLINMSRSSPRACETQADRVSVKNRSRQKEDEVRHKTKKLNEKQETVFMHVHYMLLVHLPTLYTQMLICGLSAGIFAPAVCHSITML